MKKLFTTILFLVSLNSFAAKVEVLSYHFGVEDYLGRKTLCVTVVRIPQNNMRVGIVESIEDCFYAREAKKALHRKLDVNEKFLGPIPDRRMLAHLQSLDSHLKFYYSDGD